MKINGSLARNIDFEVAKFQVLKKTRRKTSILKLQSVKIGGGLERNAAMLALMLPRVSSPVSGFPVASRVYRGSCKTSPCRRCPSRLSCCFAWQAQRFVTFQPV